MEKIVKWKNIIAYQKEPIDFLSFITLTKSNLQSEAEEMPWVSNSHLIEICNKIETSIDNQGYLSFTVINNLNIENYLEMSESQNIGVFSSSIFLKLLHIGNMKFSTMTKNYEEKGNHEKAEWCRNKIMSNYKLYKFLNDYSDLHTKDELNNTSVSIEHSHNLPFF